MHRIVITKAGRPDIHCAGNAIPRLVAEGKIMWAFWPPGTNLTTVGSSGANGIWLIHAVQYSQELDEDGEGGSTDETDEDKSPDEANHEDGDEDGNLTGEEECQDAHFESVTVGCFSVLVIDD
ncbi:hypothetical protein BDR05DRAFT_1011522 [Suillus weaverae]|nr:hypothetical protein BDR05DRAFT_1011522 [Suillus weaverae]